MKINNIDKKILKDIKNKLSQIIYINNQNNSINGVAIYQKQKCFFKIISHESFIKEINGYLVSYMKINIKGILFTKHLKRSNKYLIAYEFEDSISENEGLLNDFLSNNDLKENLSKKDTNVIEKVIDMYDKSYKKFKYQSYCPINLFFHNRVDTRLKKWYRNDKNFKKELSINGSLGKSTKEIVDETLDYFEKNSNTEYQCALTQGDPNTLNIAIKPCFFDMETAGYNPIIAELSIAIISTLIYDSYFCPKYHPKSYYRHEKTINQINYFKPKIKYSENKDNIKIESNIITSHIRKEYIKEYLNMLQKKKIKITSEIKYFIVMRLLCVFNIKKMDTDDYYYSIYLLHYFYNNINNNFYNSIIKIINEMEEAKEC